MLESKPETLQKDVGKQTLKRMSVEIPSGLSVATGALRTSVHKCVWGGGLVPTTTGSPILQPEALYCNWAWIWAKPETTISQPAKKLTFCNTLHGFQSDSQPLRKHIQF